MQWPGAFDVSERAPGGWWPRPPTSMLGSSPGRAAAPSTCTTTAARGAVLHIISGSLVETIPWRQPDGRLTFAQRELQDGVTLAFGAGHVHDVRNESSSHALSLHVYSPSLTAMTFYDCFGDRLVPRDAEWNARHDDEPGWVAPADRPDLQLVAP